MPSAFRKKLNSKRGVTLLLALLLFLVCALVGSVVLAAAYTSAGRYARSKDAQQSYLTVMSAARLVEQCVADMSYEASYVKTVEETITPQYGLIPQQDEEGNVVYDEDGEIVYVEGITGYVTEETVSYESMLPRLTGNQLFDHGFTGQLHNCYLYYHTPDEVYSGGAAGDYIADIRIQSDAPDMPEVMGQMLLSCTDNDSTGTAHFDLTVRLWDESGANGITMKFPCKLTPTYELATDSVDNSTFSYFTYGIEVDWSSPSIQKGGMA